MKEWSPVTDENLEQSKMMITAIVRVENSVEKGQTAITSIFSFPLRIYSKAFFFMVVESS